MIRGITGRIASGKSTLSQAVVAELERRGRSAQAIDLDIVPLDEAMELARTLPVGSTRRAGSRRILSSCGTVADYAE